MAHIATVPEISGEFALERYMQEIHKFPMLEPEEEYQLAQDYAKTENPEALSKLVTSHLRLVAKIARGYNGYGLPMADLIAEGTIGLMQAVKKFDPEKGFRLSTYATWWIKAFMQDYILKNWSLVKFGTTTSQRKLFFNLRTLRTRLEGYREGELKPETVAEIARTLNIPEGEIQEISRRLLGGSDQSLNAPIRSNNTEGAEEWQDWLVDEKDKGPEENVMGAQEFDKRNQLLQECLKTLQEREQEILYLRRLKEPPSTLEEVGKQFQVSKERVRQIEVAAFKKLSVSIRAKAVDLGLALG